MAASTRRAKGTRKARGTTPRRSDPHVVSHDTIEEAEQLLNKDEDRHYVFVPLDDPHAEGDYTAKGYVDEYYTPTGVRPGAVRLTKDKFNTLITRRGCKLMSVEKSLIEKREKALKIQFKSFQEQISQSQTGLSEEAEELGMRGRKTGGRILKVRNETTPLRRHRVVQQAPANSEG